jgi:hypothetical protein
MSSTVECVPVAPGFLRSRSERIADVVRLMLHAAGDSRHHVERRQAERHSYPVLINLTPVEPEALVPIGQQLVVVGKHLSRGGIGFFHQAPLAYRHVVAHFGAGSDHRLLVELTWCRFIRDGWYESGGRFLHPIQLADVDDVSAA